MKRQRRGTYKIVVTLAMIAIILWASWSRSQSFQRIPYSRHMDDTAVTVDGTKYRLRDLAFYLAHEEQTVEDQAKVYDPEDTDEYWNLHTGGSFVRVEARDAAMDLAVHDIIFYQMAQENGLTLSREEQTYMQNQRDDFWNDLEETGQQKLGVTEEEITETFLHMALARKEQDILAETQGVDAEEYNVSGSMYQALLQEHTYQINTKLWKRLNFGKITLD